MNYNQRWLPQCVRIYIHSLNSFTPSNNTVPLSNLFRNCPNHMTNRFGPDTGILETKISLNYIYKSQNCASSTNI